MLSNDARVALRRWAQSKFWQIESGHGDHLLYRFASKLISCPELDWRLLADEMYRAVNAAHYARLAVLEDEYGIRWIIAERATLVVTLVEFARTCRLSIDVRVA